jgi:hypothetical protein
MRQAGQKHSDKADVLRFAGVLAGVFALALLIGNWRSLALIVAILASEHRPALLQDAEWDAPASAARFHHRFPVGKPERDLTAWLEKNRFAVDMRARTADRQVKGLPCNETVKVDWSADVVGRLTRAEAVVSQIACL